MPRTERRRQDTGKRTGEARDGQGEGSEPGRRQDGRAQGSGGPNGRRDSAGAERDSDRRDGDGRPSSSKGIGGIAHSAIEQLAELTGKRAEFVSRMERRDDGWRLTIEVLEVERIPDSTSVLGSYEVLVDGKGNLMEYARSRRYLRNQADQVEE